MRALGFDVKKGEVLKIIKEHDKDGRGLIEFEDFQRLSEFLWIPVGLIVALRLLALDTPTNALLVLPLPLSLRL